AMLAASAALGGRAGAFSLKSTAHCNGTIRNTSGSIIVDLGTITSYHALFPQAPHYQEECAQAVADAASQWLSNPGQMCHAFLAGGDELIFYYQLGSLSPRDSGSATEASLYNYPRSCFNLSGTMFPSYYITMLIYAPPGCTPPATSSGYKCSPGSSVTYGS